ncbi:MAG TPA: hydrolase TatD, partial [Eubacterium sp.]|nr:hydrolase TatD [Eubacterium sp.]
PVPYRGQRNSALNLRYIVQKIASIKGVEYDKVVDVTYNNAKRIFLKR